MGAAKVDDQTFMEAFKRYASPNEVAKALKLDVRNVYRRRARLESRHGVRLDSADTRGNDRPKVSLPKQGFRALADLSGVVIIGSDGHFWPGERSVAFDAMIKLIKREKPVAVVMNGDSFDGARISRHSPGGWAELPEVVDELSAVKERHGEIEAYAPRNIPLVWCAGNHDSRYGARLAQYAPEYTRVHGMDIADHFPSWQLCWSLFINDHTVVKHRWHQGIHGAYNNTLKSGKSTVTGHTHRLQATMYGDYNGVRYGIETGTLSEMGPTTDKFAYAEDAPSNWGQGFVVLTFTDKGVLLEPEFCRVVGGQAYFRGKAV
jgi:hypothetical protein